jgi:hypothetical protein
MEAVTLCGLVIVTFGLWVEFEPVVKALARVFCHNNIVRSMVNIRTVEQKPAYSAGNMVR